MSNSYSSFLKEFVESSLREDVGDGDHTSLACIPPEAVSRAVVKVKEAGILSGISVAVDILSYIDAGISVRVLAQDGDEAATGTEAIHIEGNTRNLLKAERLILNCMQRMSGIATATRELVRLIEGTGAKILDTRKTTPGFRFFEKQAVKHGGGYNHRFGLYDMILIKDNHIAACGGIARAIANADEYLKRTGKNLKIEIETRNLDEVNEVLRTGGVQRIMLDNFSPEDLRKGVLLINRRYETEASGGITRESIRSVAETGVDYLSVGVLTHSVKSMDINMKIV